MEKIELTIEEALVILDKMFLDKPLTYLQEIVFRESWQGKTYAEIAESQGYDDDYIRDVGFRLWHTLSETLEEKVTKSNIQSVLRRYAKVKFHRETINYQEDEFVCPILDSCPYLLHNTDNNIPFKDNIKFQQDWGDAIDVSFFYGREEELSSLSKWIVTEGCHLVAILGIGGVGKTSLSVKLAQEIQAKFDYVIWQSLHEKFPLNQLLSTTIEFLSQKKEINLPETTIGKISLLIKYLRQHRCLLIFDGFEALFQSGEKAGTYLVGYEEYEELLQKIGELQHQSCLLLTSREKPAEVATLEGEFLPVRSLILKGLQPEAVQKILNVKGVFGSGDEIRKLIECYQGNPLALKLAANVILELFESNISAFIKEETIVFSGIKRILEQQTKRISSAEDQIIHLLAMHSDSVSITQLQADIDCEMSRAKLLESLESLTWRFLIERNAVGFALQPWLIEYIKE